MQADLLCIGTTEGEGKYSKEIGALILRDKKGREVAVGSGLSDYDRSLDPLNFIGKVIEIGYEQIIKNPKRHKTVVKMFRDIVLARIANPQSKRSTVAMLEEDFGVSLGLERVYRMMDWLDDEAIEKLNDVTYQTVAGLFDEKTLFLGSAR